MNTHTYTTGNGTIPTETSEQFVARWLRNRRNERLFWRIHGWVIGRPVEALHWLGDRTPWLPDPRYGESIFHTLGADWANSFVRDWLVRLFVTHWWDKKPSGVTFARYDQANEDDGLGGWQVGRGSEL